MINFRMLKLSDLLLWSATGILLVLGILAIFSATFRMQFKLSADPFLFVKRQSIAFLIGFIGLSLAAYFDYRHLKKIAPYVYGVTILLLGLVLFTGHGAQGAQRWIALGSFTFQPSEFSKLGLILVLSVFFANREKIKGLMDTGYLLVLMGIPFLLIFKQPDLGTALVFMAILFGMLASSGHSPKLLIILGTPIISIFMRPFLYVWIIYLLGLALYLFLSRAKTWEWLVIFGSNLAVGLALPMIWGMLKTYQQKRIVAFLNPKADPFGAGYHTIQSLIAIGGGGLFGKGFLQGTQTQLQFIPEQHSDFIFSVIGEEFGFVGSLIVIILFGVVIWRGLVIAAEARDPFGKMLASGIVTLLTFHVFANIGMVLGILPVVGIPLPFLSFGGTSLIINLTAIGILQSISMRRHKLIF
ncbi:MAG: rod shape-determining protein RodA [bacterium]